MARANATRTLRRCAGVAVIAGICAAACLDAAARAQATSPPVIRDVVYATVADRPLALDLYMPASVEQPALLVWVHGGAWQSNSKTSIPANLTQQGFAVASLDFRQATDTRFPGMVFDIKGAIRFLRAKASTYGYRADRIAIGGDSSGGHLAALVGVTGGVAALEGDVGGNTDRSSAVQAIVDYYGATDLTTILAQSTPFGLNVREPALDRLLGPASAERNALAALASPVSHVDAGDPPLLIFHGDRDPQMPINQSHELQGRYEALGLDVTFVVVHGSAHGGQAFYTGANLDRTVAFLGRSIGAAPAR